MNRAALAARIDHTLLRADATPAQIEALCEEGARLGVATVCMNGVHVARAAAALEGSGTRVCAVVGFPLGAGASRAKAAEAAIAREEGAAELDMVVSVGALKAKDDAAVAADVAAVHAAAQGAALKVILETCLLDDEEKVRGARIAVAAGAAFVKTSTGFGGGGATVEDVRILRGAVGPDVGVKASGGIKELAFARALLAAGADRLGMSATARVLAELAE